MFIWVEILLAAAILAGIRLMSTPETAVRGNRLTALSLLTAILLLLWRNNILPQPIIVVSLVTGAVIGLALALRVTMLQMPQMVALLNGLGGAASMFTAIVAFGDRSDAAAFASQVTGGLAVAVGGVTLSGSLVAAGKLHRLLPQQPVRIRLTFRLAAAALLVLLFLAVLLRGQETGVELTVWMLALGACALMAGVVLALPVGGADMPITISLLNSMSGIAASICGFVVDNAFLVAAGAIVGASGFILTRIMCGAMNRSLAQVLMGATVAKGAADSVNAAVEMEHAAGPGAAGMEQAAGENDTADRAGFDPVEALLEAKSVVIIPGYGMALGEAESQVRDIYELLEGRGADVKFAIHPVAGRMPGHMTVLLADVDIPYDKMVQIEKINPEFPQTDVALIVGACDVVNPAANTAVGTPIYGMPILHAHKARRVIICNADTKPGYSGIENPLYEQNNVVLLLGNASSTLENLFKDLSSRALDKTGRE